MGTIIVCTFQRVAFHVRHVLLFLCLVEDELILCEWVVALVTLVYQTFHSSLPMLLSYRRLFFWYFSSSYFVDELIQQIIIHATNRLGLTSNSLSRPTHCWIPSTRRVLVKWILLLLWAWAAPEIWSWGQRGGKGQGTGGNGNRRVGLWAKCRPGLELPGG